MHKSRLGAIVIDCRSDDLERDAAFWSAALGYEAKAPSAADGERYRTLAGPADDPKILLQKVDHPSRVHLDIETDDIEAEADRLEALGARRVTRAERWWVMEAPSGHRFCVVGPQRATFEDGAKAWP